MEPTAKTKESVRPRCYGHPFLLQFIFFALLAESGGLTVHPAVGPFLVILIYAALYGAAVFGLYVLGVLIRKWEVSCGILIILCGVTLLGCLNDVGDTMEGAEIVHTSLTEALIVPLMLWYPGLLLVMLAHGLFGKQPTLRTHVVVFVSAILCSLSAVTEWTLLLAPLVMVGTIIYLLRQQRVGN